MFLNSTDKKFYLLCTALKLTKSPLIITIRFNAVSFTQKAFENLPFNLSLR